MNDLLALALVYLKLSVLAFGGGIAVLPEMQREVVGRQGWLTEAQFRDSFALGQLTPGPGMLMVITAGYHVAGVPGALVAAVAMFLPTSLMTYAVGRSWDRLRHAPWLQAVERGLGPVTVGLLLGGAYTLLRSAIDDPVTGLIAATSTVVLLRWRVSPMLLIACAAVLGLIFLR